MAGQPGKPPVHQFSGSSIPTQMFPRTEPQMLCDLVPQGCQSVLRTLDLVPPVLVFGRVQQWSQPPKTPNVAKRGTVWPTGHWWLGRAPKIGCDGPKIALFTYCSLLIGLVWGPRDRLVLELQRQRNGTEV